MYDELIKNLRGMAKGFCPFDIWNKMCGYFVTQEAADTIEELLSEREENYADSWKIAFEVERDTHRWIPVTERLPEIKEHYVSDTVLVYLDDGGMSFSKLEENIFSQAWFDIERPSPDGESDYTVTHWMPLPEPPEVET